MKVCVIGGTGHIGGFLIPQLVSDGHEVTVVARGSRPVPAYAGWDKATVVTGQYKRNDPAWHKQVADIAAEVVIDILGSGVPGLYDAVRKTCRHYIATGSVWMLGSARIAPMPPVEHTPCPFDWYGMRWRELNETAAKARKDGTPFTAVLPPNICGPGKVPIDGRGGRDVEVHRAHMRGEVVYLPENCNTLIGPCDAFDVAKVHSLAAAHRDAAAGEFFNAGSPYALTAPHFIEVLGKVHSAKIPIEYVSAEKFYNEILPDTGSNYHFREHMAPDISKSREKLGYEPMYTSEQTLARAVAWMHEKKML